MDSNKSYMLLRGFGSSSWVLRPHCLQLNLTTNAELKRIPDVKTVSHGVCNAALHQNTCWLMAKVN